MVINRNTLGHLEEPAFILVKASGERVGVLQCTHKTWQHKFNDMDTISFEIPYLTNDEATRFYDDIDIMKYVEVPSIGRFCIKDIEIVNEGQKNEYKSVDCQDYSCLLGQRYIEDLSINTGTTGSINNVALAPDGDPNHSLLQIVLEKFPEWSVGYIAPSLRTKKRSFEVTKQDVYSFITDDISNAFECVFEFDSMNKTINAYEDNSTHWTDTNIHISYNSLLEKTEMSYSVDEIKTAVKLTGKDNQIDVREINLGYDYIYGMDYYASEEYMSSSLLTAYNNWKSLVNRPVTLSDYRYKTGVITQAELNGKSYSSAFTLLLSKYQDIYTQISEWTSTLLPDGINTRKNPGYGTIIVNGTKYVFDKYSSVQLVTSLPSSGNATVLYLVQNTNNMYRWQNKWINVNLWDDCCLNELKTLQAGAENLQSVAMKMGYGNPNNAEGKEDVTLKARYIDTYLPPTYMYNALAAQIKVVQSKLDTLKYNQEYYIQYDKNVITTKTSMNNNFTSAQLKELSTFIREDEITSSNFLVTDNMTEAERFDMLYALLDYGKKELAKVCVPQIQFSADLVNLFAIPEFDRYSGSFDIGNYVWVTIRDDYSIKAKILEIELDFLDQSVFNVTFGNIMKKARNIFTDVTDALNAATSAATSVSFNSSYWSAAAEDTDSIGKALADGLLSQSYYLANAANNETLIDENGVWITTVDGEHGREGHSNYDAIYLGGGRMLYTSDGWRTVSMSVGRADVMMPYIEGGVIGTRKESRFGVFADFLIAGYVGGSIIVGGDIYSSNYRSTSDKNSGNAGTHINLTDGSFEFNDVSSGRKRLTLSGNTLEVNGIIHAREGNIGSDDNGNNGFIIKTNQLYSGKTSWEDASNNGIYMNSTASGGIALGKYYEDAYKVKRNPFSVDMAGNLISTRGDIGGFTIYDRKLYSVKNSFNHDAVGIFIGTNSSTPTENGISLGRYDSATGRNKFSVDMNGKLTSTSGYIGGYQITDKTLYSNKDSFNSTTAGLFLGADSTRPTINGISLGAYDSTTKRNPFSVNMNGFLTSTSGYIGGYTIADDKLYCGKASFKNGKPGIYMDGNVSSGATDRANQGIALGAYGSTKSGRNPFSVDMNGYLVANSGLIADFNLVDSALYISKKSLTANSNGIYIGKDGIGLGNTTKYYTNSAGDEESASKFQVDTNGKLYAGNVNVKGKITATSGFIGNGISGFTITSTAIYNGKSARDNTDNDKGIYIGTNGISLGRIGSGTTADPYVNAFMVTDAGALTSVKGTIGGWSITKDSISRSTKIGDTTTKITLDAENNRINVNSKIYINGDGTINTGSKTGLDVDSSGLFISAGGIALGYKNAFKVTNAGVLTATSGKIGGWTITSNALSNGKLKDGVPDIDADAAGIFIGQTGISLGKPTKDSTTGELIHKFKVTSGGALTCTSGSIAGWSIGTSSLKSPADKDGNQTIINSNGSLQHKNGSDYNWIINTDGSATFKSITLKTDVHISGVQNGSKFGDNFGVNSSGNLWGKFSDSVGSIFASSASEPFEGKCVDHIKTLALKKLEAEWIDGDYIKADLLTADNIKAGTLSADRIAAKSITGAKIAAGTITGDKIAAGTIDADKLSVKYMTAKQVSAEISQTLKSWDGELHCATFYADGQGPWKYRVIVDGDGNSVSVLAL